MFTALSSLCIAMLYIGYLGVTAPLLLHRFRSARGQASAATAEGTDEHGKRLFSLGKWAIPVNVVAVVYQVARDHQPRLAAQVRLRPDRAHLVAAVERACCSSALTLVVGYLVHLRLRGGKLHIPHAWLHHPTPSRRAGDAALAEPEGA